MASTPAFYSWGRWVADCPNPDCTNAMEVQPGQTQFHCWIPSGVGVCGTRGDVEWPSGATAPVVVEEAYAGLAPAARSWRPGQKLPGK